MNLSIRKVKAGEIVQKPISPRSFISAEVLEDGVVLSREYLPDLFLTISQLETILKMEDGATSEIVLF